MQHRTFITIAVGAGMGLALLSGCESSATTRPTARERQDKAIKDPWNYSPYEKEPDVSGGDIDSFDREGMKHDLDRVLNP